MKKLPFLLLFLLAFPVYANKISGLYEAEVAVQDQMAGHREEAVRTAMRAVLIRVTGDRFAPQRTSLAPIIEHAGDYVQQYRYNKAAGEGPDEAGGAELTLRVQFDETALNSALRNLGVPVWGRERPTTLVWIAVQDETGRRLISLEKDPDYVRSLEEEARRRGIVLYFPLMDLEDASNLSVSDIWGGFARPVLEASQRYHADTVLVGKINASPVGIWEARWTSYINGDVSHWSAEGDLLDVVLDEGVDGQADQLAARFVGSGTSVQTRRFSILVNDVTSAQQYAEVLKFLQSLSSVTDVQVEQVEPGRVRFAVTAHGGSLAVRQTIALGRMMEPVNGADDNSYRLLP